MNGPSVEMKHVGIWKAINDLTISIDQLEFLVSKIKGVGTMKPEEINAKEPPPSFIQFMKDVEPRLRNLNTILKANREELDSIIFTGESVKK